MMRLLPLVMIYHIIPIISANTFFIPRIVLQAGYPRGFRAYVPDFPGMQYFAFHGQLNPMSGPPYILRSVIRAPVNGYWIYQDDNCQVRTNDMVSYWTHMVINRIPFKSPNMTWTAPEPDKFVNFKAPLPPVTSQPTINRPQPTTENENLESRNMFSPPQTEQNSDTPPSQVSTESTSTQPKTKSPESSASTEGPESTPTSQTTLSSPQSTPPSWELPSSPQPTLSTESTPSSPQSTLSTESTPSKATSPSSTQTTPTTETTSSSIQSTPLNDISPSSAQTTPTIETSSSTQSTPTKDISSLNTQTTPTTETTSSSTQSTHSTQTTPSEQKSVTPPGDSKTTKDTNATPQSEKTSEPTTENTESTKQSTPTSTTSEKSTETSSIASQSTESPSESKYPDTTNTSPLTTTSTIPALERRSDVASNTTPSDEVHPSKPEDNLESTTPAMYIPVSEMPEEPNNDKEYQPLFPGPFKPMMPTKGPGFEICSNPWNFVPKENDTKTQKLEKQVAKLQCDLALFQRKFMQLGQILENELTDVKKLNNGIVSRMSRLESISKAASLP